MTAVHIQFTRDDGTIINHTLSYSEFVASLAKPMGTQTLDALHGAVGLSGEAGEMLDAIKKVWVYNKEPDLTNIIEELGDLRFYWQMLLNTFNLTEQQILDANVLKLQKRYKGGYSDAAAQARADKEPGK